MVNKWHDVLLDGLFPQHCLLCGLLCAALPLCRACRGELHANLECCSNCALPLATPVTEALLPSRRLCGHCLRAPPGFDSAFAPLQYEEQLAVLMQRWKYHPDPRVAQLMADLWLQAAPASLPAVDLLVPVPLHWRKLLARGFNQAQQLCHLLHRSHPRLRPIQVDARLCRRRRATDVQAGLDARARQQNLAGAFTTRRRCDNLRVAIVDDVVTTGATANALAHCLKSAGASAVHLWCVARTPAPPE